ncbi:MAG: tetratricopeptide repeat protein [Pseudonocardiales bacterium]|nr:tetratricopeptide repeat protein [Pseudonocardiales bacterium]
MTNTPVGLSAGALAAELVVARAGLAARRGDLSAAMRLLRDVDVLTPAGLDLLARIHAQRGEFAEADECWVQVQQLDPDNEHAAAGRQTIAEMGTVGHRGRRLARSIHAGALGAAAACVVATGAVVWFVAARPPPGPPSVVPVQQHRVDSAISRAAAIAALARDLALPGIQVEAHPDHVRVSFEQGLFASSDRLTPYGAQLLTALGQRLAGHNPPTTVICHTDTVSEGSSSGGSVVALARALVAARELAGSRGCR